MKKNLICMTALILAAILTLTAVSAFAEDPEPFQIRDGISFGMSADDVIAQEIKNGTTETADEWEAAEFGGWHAIQAGNKSSYCGFDMYIMYMFANDQLVFAVYDSYSMEDDEAAFDSIASKLTEDYGEPAVLTPADIVGYMDHFVPGMYQEDSLQDGNIWETDSVTVRQFYYGSKTFVVMFSDPDFDYSSVEPASAE